MPEQDCRTVAIEVGLQNGGLASGLHCQWVARHSGISRSSIFTDHDITGSSLAFGGDHIQKTLMMKNQVNLMQK